MPTPYYIANPFLDEFEQQRAELVPPAPPAAQIPVAAPRPEPVVVPEQFAQSPEAQLAEAVQSRRNADMTAGFLDAAALINRGGGGSMPQNAGDAIRRTRDDGFGDVARERQMAHQNEQMQAEARKAALMKALARGDSPESGQIREYWKKHPIGASVLSRLPPEVAERMPGSMFPAPAEGFEMLAKAAQKAPGADAGAFQSAFDQLANENPKLKPYADAARVTPDYEAKKVLFDKANSELNRDAANNRFHISLNSVEDRFGQTMSERQRQENEKLINNASERLEKSGAPVFSQQIGNIDRIISKAKAKGESIPGVGQFSNWAANSTAYRALEPADAQELRQALDFIQNKERQKIFGASLSGNEKDSFFRAMDLAAREDTLEGALARLREANAALSRHIVKTLPADLRGEATGRFGEAAGMRQGKDGKIYQQLGPGRWMAIE
jgi:hypothetical protein